MHDEIKPDRTGLRDKLGTLRGISVTMKPYQNPVVRTYGDTIIQSTATSPKTVPYLATLFLSIIRYVLKECTYIRHRPSSHTKRDSSPSLWLTPVDRSVRLI